MFVFWRAFGSVVAFIATVKGSVFPITEQPLAIGRAADNNIRLDDELVGKHHAGLRLARRIESLKDERDLFKDQVPADDEMIGESEAIQSVRKYMRKAAGENVTVLIIGETGTGKEMVARGIHKWSARGERPFVKVSCSDMQDSLVQSEQQAPVQSTS